MPPGHGPIETPNQALAISSTLEEIVEQADVPRDSSPVDLRVVRLSAIAVVLGLAAALASRVLIMLIALITNLSFFGQFSFSESFSFTVARDHLGLWIVLIPVIGGIVVGVIARYGSAAVRGHGIPEAMEQVLAHDSRIPARVTFLKPLSSAISIGTGGPFGAEGPIIATGGALGSVIGQILHTTTSERKTLLAAGAAAGIAATFGCPVAAVLLAIELLLFEFRARSIIPVALASVAATGLRIWFVGAKPMFAMPDVAAPSLCALAFYVVLGIVVGLAAAFVTRVVGVIEERFERLPIHWMWWPAMGGLAVGIVGYFVPNTLGVGYDRISDLISNNLATQAILVLCVMKFVSWSIAVGSGTSGGTLAPLFMIGGALGGVLGTAGVALLPGFGIDVRVAALVGMAALFAGASRALLASVVMAFEATLQPMGLLPLLGGCTAAYFVSCLVMRHTIMTEKNARLGIRTPADYMADALDQILVRSVASTAVVAIKADDLLAEVRQWLRSGAEGSLHQGFPVLSAAGTLVGVLTRRDILDSPAPNGRRVLDLICRSPKFVYDDCTVRQAADHMANHGIGRLPVVTRESPPRVVGMVTRSDILSCYRRRLDEDRPEAPTVRFPRKASRGAVKAARGAGDP